MELEKVSNTGIILIVTGRTGAGKDAVFNELLLKESFVNLKFKQVVTHATRDKRENEIHGKDYYFVSDTELELMHQNNELVEPPTKTGSSYKATSKNELLKVLTGENLVWRIDLSRAAEVASGLFFDNLFDSSTAEMLKASSKVVLIDVEQETLVKRRQYRDGENYIPEEYIERDEQEIKILKEHGHHFKLKVQNLDEKLDETVAQIEKEILQLFQNRANS